MKRKAITFASAIVAAAILSLAGPAAANAQTSASAVSSPTGFAQSANAVAAYLPCNSGVVYGNSVGRYAIVPSASASELVDCVASSGLNSYSVRGLQENMNACYGKSLTVDGSFGPATRTALIQVQKAIGVTADGILGPGTRNAMLSTTHGAGCKSLSWLKANYYIIYN